MASDKTRVLFVLDRPDIVTASVRGLQFAGLLAASDQFQTHFVFRTPKWLTRFRRFWPQRRGLKAPLNLTENFTIARQERQICRLARQADLVHLAVVPSFPLFQSLRQQGSRISMDIVDALWLPWFRKWGWEHLEEMLASADGVVCENECTAQYARSHNDRVHIVPDSPQLTAFDAVRSQFSRPSDQFRIGWIGGKDTADSLYKVYEPLEELFAEDSSLHLRILGAAYEQLPRFSNVRYSTVPRYDQQIMVRETLQMHVGLFPQFHVEEQLNRGTLKAKIYMAGGAVAACEAIGENNKLVEDGVNGVLADSAQQWYQQIKRLSEDADRRQRIAAAGLQTIRDQFTAPDCLAQLLAAWQDILNASEPVPPRI